MIVLGRGRVLPPLSHVLGVYPGGMINDKFDSCIVDRLQNVHPGNVNYHVNDYPGFSMQLPWVYVNRHLV